MKVIKSVLFVCLGNICRSPTAHAIMRYKNTQLNLNLKIDSAGTDSYHKGESPDSRSQLAGEKHGYIFDGITSRAIQKEDYNNFDLILCMDSKNLHDLNKFYNDDPHNKIKRLLEYTDLDLYDVPDPYYGGEKGFDHVISLIENAINGLINEIS
ncbi:low molecular weight protein-tyrosine-phosphatase [Pseudoalteromonas denitrificans]|uniref:protein-tyrosine-phosphatase n=1 Tax=Pseudoalteromonas denitrificans DSM 6059 TaxID=1123010 RepID=A0A1I1GNJ7_9GAMM|nr:low molecular weight protein-tyrosine-phosphatase [Pseudoalteromonas denitrificans]SFC13319.1 protein-tyrosine phosphatase [Pseudoalteromonas denitrificans DSM 6059]